MNIGVHVSFWIIISSRYMPRSGIAGSYGNSISWPNEFLNEPFRIVLDLQKNYEESTESYHIPCNQFPLLSISYISMVHLLQSLNQYWYIIIKVHTLYFLSFLPNVFFCSRILSRIPHYILLSCLLRHLLSVTDSQIFLILNELQSFLEYQSDIL